MDTVPRQRIRAMQEAAPASERTALTVLPLTPFGAADVPG